MGQEHNTSETRVSKTLIQSYVFHNDTAYFVSTMDRESSALEGSPYAETLVWTWDKAKRQRVDIVHSDSGFEGSIETHFAVCKKLYEGGQEVLRNDD